MAAFKKVKKNENFTKLNQEIIDKICNALRYGNYVETAVVLAGVRKETFYIWIKKGHKNPKSIFGELLYAVERAQEEATARDLAVIERAANPVQHAIMLVNEKGEQLYDKDGCAHFIKPQTPDWAAAKWRLERRKPKEWAGIQKVELTGSEGGPMLTASETDEQRVERQKRVLALLEKRALLNGR